MSNGEDRNTIRIVIVEDHTVVRQGLVSLLSVQAGLEVVGQGGTGFDGLRLVRELSPDVLVLDLSLPDMSGIDVIADVTRDVLTCKVVVLSMHSEASYVRPAIRAGAAGYLVKGADIADLIEAIRCVMCGEPFLSPGLARYLVADAGALDANRLTERETEVLRLVAQGKTSREIATILAISPKTVENHRHNIMAKLGVHDVASLTRLALASGIVAPE